MAVGKFWFTERQRLPRQEARCIALLAQETRYFSRFFRTCCGKGLCGIWAFSEVLLRTSDNDFKVPMDAVPSTATSKEKIASAFVPMNLPVMAGNELKYITEVLTGRHMSGDGAFTARCHRWIEETTGTKKALLTHSGTAALEMAALLLDLKPGDEVIMPSFTFSSTANAVVLRGATPVFIDIRPDTLNLDENLVEAAITPRTRAIFVVHYAGVSCDMNTVMAVARRHGLMVVEDAAQAIMSDYQGQPLGTIGHLGCLSFHETKNIMSGEGGALLINDERYIERAHIIREKGTNRTAFFLGQVDKYTWVDHGSSYLPSEMTAAFLLAQLECVDRLIERRQEIYSIYHRNLAELETLGLLERPVIPQDCKSNGHIYFIILPTAAQRQRLLADCKSAGIGTTFHYIPLHSAPAGLRYGRAHGSLAHTEDLSMRMVRLPLWSAMSDEEVQSVVDVVDRVVRSL